MKHLKLLLILLLPLLFTSCFQKAAYTTQLMAGEYMSEEPFSFKNKDYTGMKLIAKEISKEDYNLSKTENTLQDFSLPLQERKYYSFEFYLLDDQNEIPISMHFDKKCNPYASGPDIYILKSDLPDEEKLISCPADFRVSWWAGGDTLEERIYYGLYFY
ncbi:MAG: hypothetical protein K2J85_03060 [Anaeroplasmataceae bacterium]|nr:hypothetical protein [Anaeroplasmataceae bacterium]